MTVSQCTLSGNSGVMGGGIINAQGGGTVTVSQCTLSGNSGSYGGGICNRLFSTLTVTNSTLSGNTSGFGGGIYNEQLGTATVSNSTLSGNSGVEGGGIDNSGMLTVSNSTLSGNSASGDYNANGGGISNGGTLTVSNCTLSLNSATSNNNFLFFGGGIGNGGLSTLALNNAIVANTPSGGDVTNFGDLTGSHNLIEDGSDGLPDTITGDPNLGPLANNGGPTQTMALLPGSPAIDAGDNALIPAGVTTDQRGLPRIVNGTVDIGAFEVQTVLTTTVLTTSASPSTYGQSVTFTATVSDTSGAVPTGSVEFYDGTADLGPGSSLGGSGQSATSTFTTSTLAAGVHSSISAIYTPTGNFGGSSGSLSQTANPAAVTVTVNSASRPYLQPNPTFTASYSGFQNGDTFASAVTGIPTLTTTATQASPAGNYTITAAAGTLTSGNYAFSYVNGTLTVTDTKTIYVLNPTSSGALTVSGHSTITIPGLLQVDSGSASAVQAKGNAQVQAGSIQVVGGVSTTGHATVNPSPVTHVLSVPDPLASLPAVPNTLSVAAQPSIKLSGVQTMIISPGNYREISVSGHASLFLNPGIYVIAGGGFTVTGHASVVMNPTGSADLITGSGVLIYNAGSNYIVKHDNQGDHDGQHYFGMERPSDGGWNYGGITISGDGNINLTAPTIGTYAGVVIFQARDNPRAIELDGHATVALSSRTIYAKGALLEVSGDSQVKGTLVVDRLALNGDAGSSLSADGSLSISEGVAGELLAGDLFVYVNDPSGLFTADELARIQDAIASMNRVLAPYNVVVTEVGAANSDQANVIIDIGTSTPVGGFADGVLGCETTSPGSSEITLVQGWNWYEGADSTAVGSDQFDFQTVVTHELGHALGLGHNPDGSSVMYSSLATGTARRSLTVTDLNIPDPGTGSDGLHAAIPFHNVAGGLTANTPAPTVSIGVAVLDEVLSGWNEADSGISRGIAHPVSGNGSHVVVQPLVATRSTASDRSSMGIDPNSADVLFDQGAITRSPFGDSTPPIRKKLFGALTL